MFNSSLIVELLFNMLNIPMSYNWIHWAQDSDRWRALANTVMNLRVP
jgi:hypothetical protein